VPTSLIMSVRTPRKRLRSLAHAFDDRAGILSGAASSAGPCAIGSGAIGPRSRAVIGFLAGSNQTLGAESRIPATPGLQSRRHRALPRRVGDDFELDTPARDPLELDPEHLHRCFSCCPLLLRVYAEALFSSRA